MSAFVWVLISIAGLLSTAGRACDDNQVDPLIAAARQQSANYLADAYGFDDGDHLWSSYDYPSNRAPVPQYESPYEGRSPLSRLRPNNEANYPYKNYLSAKDNNIKEATRDQPMEGRFALSNVGASLLNAGIFGNRFSSQSTTLNPFSGLGSRLPISWNPNYVNRFTVFDSCTSPAGASGICAPGAICSLFGGAPSGSCVLGVCCVNVVTTCGGTITLNNTYWQSPSTAISAPSTCLLTVKLNNNLIEQKKPICQVRLDFVSFSITQPNYNSVCNVDTFQATGAKNTAPVICGDNNGQHMYLTVPSSATTVTNLQLMFNFGSGSTGRTWNIKISMLPCGATYLAPSYCLQYFTGSAGQISSFNWKDTPVTGTSTRQLANQNYNICFRNELVQSQVASQVCLSVCTPLNGGNSYYLTTKNATSTLSSVGTTDCVTDFLLFPNGNTVTYNGTQAINTVSDRFCGGSFNPNSTQPYQNVSTTVCSTIKPFRLTYITDNNENCTVTSVGANCTDTNNVGFCFNYATLP